ncbi:MAG: hypothetical protein HY883_00690 [Deltaproteobacteria bacterium]|nr:hypothetical protein [Deltaproteobacteria bacterium]
MSHPLFRRRKKIVKPGYQMKVAFSAAIALFLYSLVLGFIIFYPLSQELYSAATVEDKMRVSELILGLHRRVWPAVFAVSILVYIHAILASHRVAGPVYRLEKAMKDFMAGKFGGRVRLRKSDQFQEVGEVTIRLAGYLEEAKKRDVKLHAAVRETLSNVHSVLKKTGTNDEAMKALSGLIKELDTLPDAFTDVSRPVDKGV